MRNTPDLFTFLGSQGCLTEEHVLELESEGLMDCSQVDPNPTGILFRGATCVRCYAYALVFAPLRIYLLAESSPLTPSFRHSVRAASSEQGQHVSVYVQYWWQFQLYWYDFYSSPV